MAKNVLHDIMTKEQRSIREVPLPHHRRGSAPALEEDILYEREEFQIEESSPGLSWRRIILWGATGLFLILLGVALATSFTGATITVTPKAQVVQLDHEFIASRSTDLSAQTGLPAQAGFKLGFEALPIRETVEAIIPADTAEKVIENASGTIVIYNNFSDKPQRLIKNTRFETKDGLIYRIASSVTIPGKTTKDGRTIPGSFEAIVTADAPGAEYNIPLSDFTVPGFKGDSARFAGFYARSKTPMTGGFEGMVKIPSETALNAARASLQEKLVQQIESKKQGLVPQGYVLFSGAISLKNDSLPPEERKGEMSAVREEAAGAAYLFKKEDIAKAIAAAALPSWNDLPVEIPDLETLTFEMKEVPSLDPAEAKTLRFTLKGNVRVVWQYDEAKLKSALIGKSKDDLAAALSAFPTIEKVDLVIRPFWSRSFPENPKKVSIEKAVPKAAVQSQ